MKVYPRFLVPICDEYVSDFGSTVSIVLGWMPAGNLIFTLNQGVTWGFYHIIFLHNRVNL